MCHFHFLSGKVIQREGVFQLFISVKSGSEGLPVPKSRISHWIVDIIHQVCGYVGMDPPVGIQAHLTQVLSTSVTCEWGLSFQDLCSAATWADGHGFAKFYNLDTLTQEQQAQAWNAFSWKWTGILYAHTLS